ncbi:hypothetical protein [Marinobacter mobilis]|uniref:hypothetical protein n=1 Tax=Marinobacter mobilis TaxID=488533 RepID=UPI0035C6669A
MQAAKTAYPRPPEADLVTRPAPVALNTAFSVYVADVEVVEGPARLRNIEHVHEEQTSFVEVQDFVPGDQALTLSTYWSPAAPVSCSLFRCNLGEAV